MNSIPILPQHVISNADVDLLSPDNNMIAPNDSQENYDGEGGGDLDDDIYNRLLLRCDLLKPGVDDKDDDDNIDDNDSVMSGISDFSWGSCEDKIKSNNISISFSFQANNDKVDKSSRGRGEVDCASTSKGSTVRSNNTNTIQPQSPHLRNKDACDSYDDDAQSCATAQQYSIDPTTNIAAKTLMSVEPKCSMSQLIHEINTLSLEEKVSIKDDLFGNYCCTYSKSSSVPTRKMEEADINIQYSEVLDKFYVEVEHLLATEPKDKTSAYREALSKCNVLLDEESNPLRFLRCEDYNPKAAARRLILYWETRKRIFGAEKCFLPMTLQGAMADDVDIITTIPTFFRLLPCDNKGRTVICFDKEGVDMRSFSAVKFVKYIWYIIHFALASESTQIKGIVLVANIPSFSVNEYDRERTRLLASDCLPIKIRSAHFIVDSFFLNIVLPIHLFFMRIFVRRRIQLHSGTQEEKITSLENFGLSRDGLPTSIGGNYI